MTCEIGAGVHWGEVLISPARHRRAWRLVEAEGADIATKHEGELAAFPVVKAPTPTTSDAGGPAHKSEEASR